MDWVMKNSVQECAGKDWIDGSKLGDLDFIIIIIILFAQKQYRLC